VQISLICTLRTVATMRLDLRHIGGYARAPATVGSHGI
jgi:hypothetical protein